MRVAELIIASCMLAVSGAGPASAQVEPLRVLEQARRDRLEMDKRLAREAVARRLKEQADQAAQANAQRKLEKERAVAGTAAPTPLTTPPGPLTPSTPHEPSSAREVVPGAPIAAASSAGAPATPASAQVAASPDGERTTFPPGSPTESANEVAPSGQSGEPGASPVDQAVPGSATPATPASGAASDLPAPDQPVAQAPVEPPVAPPPRVVITVDKATQRMRVTVDGKLRYTWAVSTGRPHFETPAGTFRPLQLARVHYSREWDDAPMPYSIFFTGRGHAIHASNDTRRLGRPASHGCVRLAPAKAAALFALVRAEGPGATRITITSGKGARRAVEARARRQARRARPARI